MFDPKIKISRDLYDKLKAQAEKAGYSSVDELIRHVLEKAVEPSDNYEKDVEKQLKGLGYIE